MTGLSYRSRSSRIARIGLQHRTIFNFFRKGSKNPPLDPLDFQVTHRKPTAPLPPPTPQRGDLASDSIFNTPSLSAGQDAEVIESPALQGRDPTLMEAALNPRPVARARWQRKMLIRSIQHRGRINKAVKLLRTERSHAAKSHFLETSVKKLYPLARQIAGKTIEDALIQMRFSKKRVAADVLKHLEYARDQAIVTRGMGLGKVGTEANAQTAGEAKPIVVREKNGRRRTIQDSTSMYIDQAWVGRGKKMWGVEFRAKGRTNMLHIPSTSMWNAILSQQLIHGLLTLKRHHRSAEGGKYTNPLGQRA